MHGNSNIKFEEVLSRAMGILTSKIGSLQPSTIMFNHHIIIIIKYYNYITDSLHNDYISDYGLHAECD